MKIFFERYADLTALILTFLLPVIVTIWIKRKTGKGTKAIPVWLMVFGPLGILSFIFFHLFDNTYRAITGIINGTFVYNFHFYSLILFGVAMAAVASSLLRACVRKCLRKSFPDRLIFLHLLLIVIVTAPLLPITPISAIPLICSVFSLSGLAFARRKQKPVAEILMPDKHSATA